MANMRTTQFCLLVLDFYIGCKNIKSDFVSGSLKFLSGFDIIDFAYNTAPRLYLAVFLTIKSRENQ